MSVSVKKAPHYSVSAEQFASWLEGQPSCWWFVDGDPLLTGRVDFPCPGEELADAVRRLGKTILLSDQRRGAVAQGERIDPAALNELADRANRRNERTFLCCWEDSDVDWLLSEDTEAAMQAR